MKSIQEFPYADYISFLQERITPPRLEHSIGVMRVMGELADIYGLDRTQAMSTGLLHDAAKDFTEERLLALAEQAGITFAHPSERLPIYLHAPVGAYVVADELKINDRLVLDAIATHSFGVDGENYNTPFAWCLRSADVVEPTRNWLGMNKLKSVVYAGRIDEAALLHCGWLVEYFHEIDIPVHPILTREFQTRSAKLKVPDSFFERW